MSIWARLTEPLLGRRAIERATSYRDAMRVRQFGGAALARATAARALSDDGQDTAALALYREAFGLAVSALLVARTETLTDPLPPQVAWAKLEGEIPKALRGLEALMTKPDSLAPDRLKASEARRRRDEADRLLRFVCEQFDTRTPRRLRVLRGLKLFFFVVAPVALVIALLLTANAPKNIGRDKPAIASSRRPGTPPATGATDGVLNGRCGFITNQEREPWLRIDLLRYHSISEVRVFGRAEKDETLVPLVIELSADGDNFKQVAERSEPFSESSPWKARLSGELARYVRIRSKNNPGHLCLGEVEVYGKPQ